MEYKQSLSRRIVFAFVLMTAAVGGLFSVGIVGVVHVVEERLISHDLGGELDRILQADLAIGQAPKLDPGMRFFISDGQGVYAMPPALRRLDEGFHEVFDGELSFHALVRDEGGRRFVLLQDQSDFEAREQVLYASVVTGYVLSLTLAGLLGWLLSRKVMEPVARLARQVRHRDQLLELAPPMAPDYARDEVGELASAFDYAMGRLHDVLTREKLFTSDVSHELRTPLMVIATSCELLAEEPGLSARARSQLARMTSACEEMRDLVQTFLLLARAQRKDMGIVPQAGLLQIAEELVGQWRGPIEAKGLRLEFVGAQAMPGQFNAPFLRSVMSNLLRNAMHYTETGSIRLQLSATGFWVEDTGAGIPEEQRERVFQPFVRGANPRGEGLGLGLSLVKRICASEGWDVSLHPVEPHGCRFEVCLAVL
ncbi:MULTISPECIES: HAMP domain-containing sensor histidine kinase [unclassified Pseudomonas]|uniref:sensor histidine kinase n=1 Tax=unclassified Pseudomonas TaxID=196821 RepID=UPI0023D84252|nr:HAMP domain-containing sensor histidine kinase [Pseudomonas sp. PSE14]WEJ73369.1 HAMP domain-containing sensor histidine kinase [Pseudomonas sp. PSE14]